MKKRKFLTASSAALAAIAFTTSTIPVVQVSAKDNPVLGTITENELEIGKETVSKADNYITFNKETNEFVVDKNGLLMAVSSEEYESVLANIANTNKEIKSSLNNLDGNTNVRVVTPNNEKISLYESKTRDSGKNDLEWHWNYVRIYLTADTATTAFELGYGLAGIFIPIRVVQAACFLLAFGAEKLPLKRGIWFDANYFMGGLTNVRNAGWQTWSL